MSLMGLRFLSAGDDAGGERRFDVDGADGGLSLPPSADFASEERAVLEENCLSNKTPVHGARPCWPSKTRDNGSTHAPLWTRHLSNVTGGVQSITCCESCY